MMIQNYGTVLKLRELGIVEKKHVTSGRILPYIISDTWEGMPIFDNGLTNGKHWRFIKFGPGSDFDFSENELPITVTITDNATTATNSKGAVIRYLTEKEGQLLIDVFRAFYPGQWSDIRLDDQRKAILLEKKNWLLASLEEKKKQFQEEIGKVDAEIEALEEEEL